MGVSNLKARLSVRVSKKTYDSFIQKAGNYGTSSEVHRELIEAFIQGEPTDLKKKESLYVS
jgi:hypothetical protein